MKSVEDSAMEAVDIVVGLETVVRTDACPLDTVLDRVRIPAHYRRILEAASSVHYKDIRLISRHMQGYLHLGANLLIPYPDVVDRRTC